LHEVLLGLDELVDIHSLSSIYKRIEKEKDPASIAVHSFADGEDRFPSFAKNVNRFKVICPDIDYPLGRDFAGFFAKSDDAARCIDE